MEYEFRFWSLKSLHHVVFWFKQNSPDDHYLKFSILQFPLIIKQLSSELHSIVTLKYSILLVFLTMYYLYYWYIYLCSSLSFDTNYVLILIGSMFQQQSVIIITFNVKCCSVQTLAH